MFRGFGFAVMGLVALSGTAQSADMYAPPASYKDTPCCASVWTGFYVGENGGYALGAHHDQLALSPAVAGVRPEGAFAGGQIGYNWQGLRGYSPLVLSIEADLQWSGIHDKGLGNSINVSSSSLDWFGTVRGRLGYAFEHALIYGTGGLAYGGIHNRVQFPLAGLNGIYDIGKTATGYVAGGGIETKLSPSWSVKAEYLYVNLGVNDPVNAAIPAGFPNTYSKAVGGKVFDDSFNVVRAGLNYQIGSGYVPLK
jgi:outer membrane immunogenic protein